MFLLLQNTAADVSTSQLQHGLVRWVQNYGEHILKTLIARSPKLPHPRQYSNSMIPGARGTAGGAVASTLNGHGGSNGASAAGSIGGRPPQAPNSGGRTNKFGGGGSSRGEGGMLVPPTYLPAASFRPPSRISHSRKSNQYLLWYDASSSTASHCPLRTDVPHGSQCYWRRGKWDCPHKWISNSSRSPSPSSPSPFPRCREHDDRCPSLDSSLVAVAAAQQQYQQQTQGQSSVLYMRTIGMQQQQPQLQSEVTLNGSPIQQKDFICTHPSSPVGFKVPPPIAAIAGEGPDVGGSEEASVLLMESIQQPPGAAAAA